MGKTVTEAHLDNLYKPVKPVERNVIELIVSGIVRRFWFNEIKPRILREAMVYYFKWPEIDRLKAELKAERERKAKLYADMRSACGEVWKLRQKLVKTKEWNKRHVAALAKAKEQIEHDHLYIAELKKRIEDQKKEIALLWEDREVTEIIAEPAVTIGTLRRDLHGYGWMQE